MPPDEFAEARKKSGSRHKKADIYKDYVVECLQNYPDMTAARSMTGSKNRQAGRTWISKREPSGTMW